MSSLPKAFARSPILFCTGILALAAIVFLILFLSGLSPHQDESLPASVASLSIDHSSNGSPTRRALDDRGDSKSPVETQIGMRFITYTAYLDKLCPPLSEAEEDRLLAESGESTKVLLGLFFGNTPRSLRWLQKALLKAPEDPLVHYAVLGTGFPQLNRPQSAMELLRLAPEDAAPRYLLALEALKNGNLEDADKYLRDASQRENSSSYKLTALQLMIDNYVAAGRSEAGARARVALQYGGGSKWDDKVLGDLATRLNVVGPDGVTLWGSDERIAMLIDADKSFILQPILNSCLPVVPSWDKFIFLK